VEEKTRLHANCATQMAASITSMSNTYDDGHISVGVDGDGGNGSGTPMILIHCTELGAGYSDTASLTSISDHNSHNNGR
jgi:hypothetical protein